MSILARALWRTGGLTCLGGTPRSGVDGVFISLSWALPNPLGDSASAPTPTAWESPAAPRCHQLRTWWVFGCFSAFSPMFSEGRSPGAHSQHQCVYQPLLLVANNRTTLVNLSRRGLMEGIRKLAQWMERLKNQARGLSNN